MTVEQYQLAHRQLDEAAKVQAELTRWRESELHLANEGLAGNVCGCVARLSQALGLSHQDHPAIREALASMIRDRIAELERDFADI